jgi:hypothetical protein
MKRGRIENDDGSVFVPLDMFYNVVFRPEILSVLQRYLSTHDVFALSSVNSRMCWEWTAKGTRTDALQMKLRLAQRNLKPGRQPPFEFMRRRSVSALDAEITRYDEFRCWECGKTRRATSLARRSVFERTTCTLCASTYFMQPGLHYVDPVTGERFADKQLNDSTKVVAVRDFKGWISLCGVHAWLCLQLKCVVRPVSMDAILRSEKLNRATIPFDEYPQEFSGGKEKSGWRVEKPKLVRADVVLEVWKEKSTKL